MCSLAGSLGVDSMVLGGAVLGRGCLRSGSYCSAVGSECFRTLSKSRYLLLKLRAVGPRLQALSPRQSFVVILSKVYKNEGKNEDLSCSPPRFLVLCGVVVEGATARMCSTGEGFA